MITVNMNYQKPVGPKLKVQILPQRSGHHLIKDEHRSLYILKTVLILSFCFVKSFQLLKNKHLQISLDDLKTSRGITNRRSFFLRGGR